MSSNFLENKKILIESARKILRGERKSSEELNQLCLDLDQKEEFSYATEILLTLMAQGKQSEKESLRHHQVLAKYIYKDQSLPSTFKFDRALRELNLDPENNDVKNCETLGLAGAIYKRKWQFDNQMRNLELSDHYYGKGYQCWQLYLEEIKKIGKAHSPAGELNDDGYTAINHAYTTELITIVRLRELGKTVNLNQATIQGLEKAASIRKFIISQFVEETNDKLQLKSDQYDPWVIASVAEAYFGLRDYKKALHFTRRYLETEKSRTNDADKLFSWKIKSFTQQIFSIATSQENFKYLAGIVQGSTDPTITKVATEINEESIRECLQALGWVQPTGGQEHEVVEKKGLALSGGGFRAALFHIGVLASLAEHDKLRDIEVISCVSGGSIIGAFYHLKLKKLLEKKKDQAINPSDYIEIVKEIEQEFLAGVQKNLRMRIFINLLSNFKMLGKKYSRSHRLGELYEKHLYKQLIPNKEKLLMSELFINPIGCPDFAIDVDNWKRRNKVPQLILNATSVNTGHNWQFTASWMGEPPGTINDTIDVKPRLRRMYYKDAPVGYKNFRLGYAVAASSCVPVMFEPLPMKDLYPGVDLQLIDGGLHDNQGIASLLEQECKSLFISDASGQLSSSKDETKNEASLFFRADNILQERLREIQFMDLEDRHRTSQISVLQKVHLKSGLLTNPVSWINCTDPPRKLVYERNFSNDTDLTEYGILRSVQLKLSELRTDLDSFNDVESYALMYSGYRQTGKLFNEGSVKRSDWKFLDIEPYMTNPSKAEKIFPHLKAGKKLAFKVLDLNTMVKVGAVLISVLILWVTGCWILENWDKTVFHPWTVKALVIALGLFVVGLISKPLGIALNFRAAIWKAGLVSFAIIAGFSICLFYIVILNPIYNFAGRIKR